MKCREIEEHLSAYIAEETTPDLRRPIKSHLKGCKKCRARLAALKGGTDAPEKQKELAPRPTEAALPSKESPVKEAGPPPASVEASLSAGWRRPVEVMVMILFIGGMIYFYQREGSDLKADFSTLESPAQTAAEAPTPPSASVNEGIAAAGGSPPSPPAQTTSAPPAAHLPMKVHKATTQSMSREARRQATLAQPSATKLLLISRNVKEATARIAAQAKDARGKVLSRRGGEMEAKVVLLIPAERYGTFSQSLQSLGLVKEISKSQPPSGGPLKVEVMIE